MFTLPRGPAWMLAESLASFHPSHASSLFGGSRSRAAEHEVEEALASLPPHLRGDVGLPSAPTPAPEHPALSRARRRASRWGT